MNRNQVLEIAGLITEDPQIFTLLLETYEEGAHPSIRDFWSNIRRSQHPFSAHPLLAMYGAESAEKAYGHTVEQLQRTFPELEGVPPQQIMQAAPQLAMQVFQQIARMEAPHRQQLEELAKNLVSRIWGVPTEILDAKLGPPEMPEMEEDDFDFDMDDDDDDFEFEMPEMDVEQHPIDREQVNKRITMNALTQGAAVHNMATIHHAAADQLQEIDPQLLQAYGKFASGSTHMYWLMDFANMTREMLSHSTVGTTRVTYGEEEDEGEFQELGGEEEMGEEAGPMPTIIARAINFPVLVQELVKGVMELLSHHGLEGLSKQQLQGIYQEADRLEDEPWLIQVGPHLWRSFLKIVPPGHSLAEIMASLATKEPQYIHNLLSETIEAVHRDEDPTGPREALAQMMQELEEQGAADFDEEDYGEIGYEDYEEAYEDPEGGYEDPEGDYDEGGLGYEGEEDEEDENWDLGEPW